VIHFHKGGRNNRDGSLAGLSPGSRQETSILMERKKTGERFDKFCLLILNEITAVPAVASHFAIDAATPEGRPGGGSNE